MATTKKVILLNNLFVYILVYHNIIQLLNISLNRYLLFLFNKTVYIKKKICWYNLLIVLLVFNKYKTLKLMYKM